MFGIKTMDSKGQWPLAGLSYVRRKMQGKRDGGHGQHLSIHIFLCHSIYVKVFIHSGKRKCPYSLANMLHESVIVISPTESVSSPSRTVSALLFLASVCVLSYAKLCSQ